MPITWNVNHSDRTVDATVDGTLNADDVAAFIEHLAQERAMPYSKVFDATSADDLLSPADVKVLGRRLREIIMTGQGPLGPLAFVVRKSECPSSEHLAQLGALISGERASSGS